jgi:hypothetical protein
MSGSELTSTSNTSDTARSGDATSQASSTEQPKQATADTSKAIEQRQSGQDATGQERTETKEPLTREEYQNSVRGPAEPNITDVATVHTDNGLPQSGPDPEKLNAGSLEVIGSGFSPSEWRAAEYFVAEGRNVTLREATGIGRTSDLLADGVPYDVYTPTTSNVDRIVGAIATKSSQVDGGGVVVDLSESPLRADDLGNLLPRVRGVTDKIKDIVIIDG